MSRSKPKYFVYVPALKLDTGEYVGAIVFADFLKARGLELKSGTEPLAVFDYRYEPGFEYIDEMVKACDRRYARLLRQEQKSQDRCPK
jgi:hypothetical protein